MKWLAEILDNFERAEDITVGQKATKNYGGQHAADKTVADAVESNK